MSLRETILKKTDEAIEAIKLPFKIKKEKKELEKWILNKEEEMATLELKIADLKSSKDISIDKLLDIIDDLDLTKRRLIQGEYLLEELYKD